MEREIICTVCPQGCHILVEGEGAHVESIKNYSCKRGYEYATTEFVNPCRILTTSVRVEGRRMLPVRTSKPIPRELLMPCMSVIKEKSADVPVRMHQVIVTDILGTGTDVIACMPIE